MLPSSTRGSLSWTLFSEKKSYTIDIKTDGVYYISRDFSVSPNVYKTYQLSTQEYVQQQIQGAINASY